MNLIFAGSWNKARDSTFHCLHLHMTLYFLVLSKHLLLLQQRGETELLVSLMELGAFRSGVTFAGKAIVNADSDSDSGVDA